MLCDCLLWFDFCRIETRSKYSRRRQFRHDADVDYINERNMKFNKKAARFYDPYTAEIKQNLERGTAIWVSSTALCSTTLLFLCVSSCTCITISLKPYSLLTLILLVWPMIILCAQSRRALPVERSTHAQNFKSKRIILNFKHVVELLFCVCRPFLYSLFIPTVQLDLSLCLKSLRCLLLQERKTQDAFTVSRIVGRTKTYELLFLACTVLLFRFFFSL